MVRRRRVAATAAARGSSKRKTTPKKAPAKKAPKAAAPKRKAKAKAPKAAKAPAKRRGSRGAAKKPAKAPAKKAAPSGGGGTRKRKGRKRGRSLKTFALMRKGAKYNARLKKGVSGLRRYTPLSTPLRGVKSSQKQKNKARKYYKTNKAAILRKAKQRYDANPTPAKRYAKRYYAKNKPNVNYRRSQLRATRGGKGWNVNKAKKRGVGTRSRKRSRKS